MRKILFAAALVAVVSSALFAAGCSQPLCTSERGGHTWGQWSNEWEKTNLDGYMRQIRRCETCGLQEARASK
jgi:hypothetical protein